MTFKKILVPYDGSKYARSAFKMALEFADKYDSKIIILTCLVKPAYRGVWYQDSRHTDAILKREEKAAKENISKLIATNRTEIPIAVKVIPTIDVSGQIVSFAKSQKIDLIVMGSHGKTGFDKVLLGSVAQKVSQKAQCPIMIAKKEQM